MPFVTYDDGGLIEGDDSAVGVRHESTGGSGDAAEGGNDDAVVEANQAGGGGGNGHESEQSELQIEISKLYFI